MPPSGIQTHYLSRRAAVDLRFRPRGHWDRLFWDITQRKLVVIDISGQPIGPIFKDQEDETNRLSRNVDN